MPDDTEEADTVTDTVVGGGDRVLVFRPWEHRSEQRTGTVQCLARNNIAPYLEADHIVTAI